MSYKKREAETSKKERMSEKTKKMRERKQVSIYAKESEFKSEFLSNQPMIVLLYKEAYFYTNKLDIFSSSVVFFFSTGF